MAEIKIKEHEMIGFSQANDDEVVKSMSAFGAHHYERLGLVVRKTEGAWLYDKEGNKYLDCPA